MTELTIIIFEYQQAMDLFPIHAQEKECTNQHEPRRKKYRSLAGTSKHPGQTFPHLNS
jgi:hypothetical protein